MALVVFADDDAVGESCCGCKADQKGGNNGKSADSLDGFHGCMVYYCGLIIVLHEAKSICKSGGLCSDSLR